MRPAWDAVIGWLLLVTGFVLAIFVVPYPHNGYALLAVVSGIIGALLVGRALTRQREQR